MSSIEKEIKIKIEDNIVIKSKDMFSFLSMSFIVLVVTFAWYKLLNTCWNDFFAGRDMSWFLAVPFLMNVSFYVYRDFLKFFTANKK